MLISQLEELPTAAATVAVAAAAAFVPGELMKEEEELDTALKMAHIEMYDAKLRERERRKRVARDHMLISRFYSTFSVVGAC